jgi:electron transfer flavoprotein alpha/beta subunit
VGVKGSPTIVATLSNRESKRQVQFIQGTREEKAQQLVQRLAEAGML